MSIEFNDYHHPFGMENYDGGNDRWDSNKDGHMSLFEENSRFSYDQVLKQNMFGDESVDLNKKPSNYRYKITKRM